MNIHWRDLLRHYLQVVAFCSVIAVLTSAIWPRKSYLVQLGYSLAVGTIIWAVIDFGRYVVDERNCHRNDAGGHGWPKGWRGVLLAATGIACGFVFGEPLGNLLLGDGVVPSAQDSRISLVITLVAGAVGTFYFFTRGKAAALIAERNAAERDASEARLKLLETQLEPHMLFNTLANLRVLITLDPTRAVQMLDHLNSYLRVTLSGSRSVMHPLSAEFDRLRDYLELMSIRMGARLHYTLELPDDLRDTLVPPLLLQPLVENSIRHGLEPQVEGGKIVVRARRESDSGNGNGNGNGKPRIVIEVSDTGIGLGSAPPSVGGGFGLAQVRERLATVYGVRGGLEMAAAADGGTRAVINFPI